MKELDSDLIQIIKKGQEEYRRRGTTPSQRKQENRVSEEEKPHKLDLLVIQVFMLLAVLPIIIFSLFMI